MPPRSKIAGHIVFVLSVILSFCLKNLNLANNFRTMSARALIFHMSIPCYKTFSWVPLTLEIDLLFENFNPAYNYSTMSDRVLIFHMSIPCDKIFPLVPTIFTLWPTPWSLIYFLENWTVSARVFIFHLIIINCYKTDANYHRSQRVFFNNRCLKIRERYLKKGTYTWISCTGQF